MRVVAFLAPWVALGIAVVAIAFRGGPGRAREAYRAAGGLRGLRFGTPLLYLAPGVAIPLAIIAAHGSAVGGKGRLAAEEPNKQLIEGKALFRAYCATCHTLAAQNAHGVTGPNLDTVGQMTRDRVLKAIEVGGTGQGRMPARILQGGDAEAVAAYVAKVAGR